MSVCRMTSCLPSPARPPSPHPWDAEPPGVGRGRAGPGREPRSQLLQENTITGRFTGEAACSRSA